MIKSDYRNEIGVGAADKKVAWPVALAILAIVALSLAGLAWFFKGANKTQNHATEPKNKLTSASLLVIGRNDA